MFDPRPPTRNARKQYKMSIGRVNAAKKDEKMVVDNYSV